MKDLVIGNFEQAALSRKYLDGENSNSSRLQFENIFCCPEESMFYANCLENFLFRNDLDINQQDNQQDEIHRGVHQNTNQKIHQIIEFGSGDGSPVINALLRHKFSGFIEGFELNPTACQVGKAAIHKYNLQSKYQINNSCLFASNPQNVDCLIANPPYLPAPDQDICMPLLFGGIDGATMTNKLLSLNYDRVVILIASYSNPQSTIKHAKSLNYNVEKFTILPLEFGYYSSEPKVKNHIAQMRDKCIAFYSRDYYLLAGVLFSKAPNSRRDLSKELLSILTGL